MTPQLQFTRQFLQDIRNEASNVAVQTLNPQWRRAWEALADAADRLDAMQARSAFGTAVVAEVARG
jgi:hypothetical protein